MFSKVITAGIRGVQGFEVVTETDSSQGFPSFNMVGALSKEAREARFRVSTALKNSGFSLKPKKYTVNLSPAGIYKEGTGFDLSIAVSILESEGTVKDDVAEIIRNYAFIGELGLDGEIKPVRGVLPMAAELFRQGVRGIVTAASNSGEAALAGIGDIIGIENLGELIRGLESPEAFTALRRTVSPESTFKDKGYDVDFSEVKGQAYLKRAVEIAAAGSHNILISGPAGAGKTMLCSRIPTILPALTREEDLKISEIYSICGMLPKGRPLLGKRPFRAPHHSITPAALAGGGANAVPGELSLASKGVLFLDEFPLFSRNTIEILRQPLESKKITVTRLKGVYEYPADFLFAAAMNSCPCGHYPDRSRCRCTEAQIRNYRQGLSKPIMDRIDILASARTPSFEELSSKEKGESSEKIRARVEETRERQRRRMEKMTGDARTVFLNGELGSAMTERLCRIGGEEESFLKEVFYKKGLSARLYHKILKLSRTIADMEGCERIGKAHIAEAIGLRNGDEGGIFE